MTDTAVTDNDHSGLNGEAAGGFLYVQSSHQNVTVGRTVAFAFVDFANISIGPQPSLSQQLDNLDGIY